MLVEQKFWWCLEFAQKSYKCVTAFKLGLVFDSKSSLHYLQFFRMDNRLLNLEQAKVVVDQEEKLPSKFLKIFNMYKE